MMCLPEGGSIQSIRTVVGVDGLRALDRYHRGCPVWNGSPGHHSGGATRPDSMVRHAAGDNFFDDLAGRTPVAGYDGETVHHGLVVRRRIDVAQHRFAKHQPKGVGKLHPHRRK